METPMSSTLLPKQMAPNPHANPKDIAKRTAEPGARLSTRIDAPEEKTIAAGITRQATTINVSQMFSHFQRDSTFMGVVNKPLQRPESSARMMPVVAIAAPKTYDARKKLLTNYHNKEYMSSSNVYTTSREFESAS